METLITIAHMTKVLAGQVALDDVNLTIKVGSTHARVACCMVAQHETGNSQLA